MKANNLVIAQKPGEPSLAVSVPVETKAESLTTPGSMTPNAGRKKENVCGDVALRETAMSTSSLSAMSFELPNNFHEPKKNSDTPDALYVSSGSSTCTRESEGACSDIDCNHTASRMISSMERGSSEKLNAKVALQKTSRQGRDTQRWVFDSENTIRLVTGCVPILKGGKIMFVSASRKPEWILPKGGWELDEAMEESAVRECFEEAGVLGMLGPKLATVEYETRKAKKRRLEQEEFQRSCVRRTGEKEATSDDGNRTSDDGNRTPNTVDSNRINLLPDSLLRIRDGPQRLLSSGHASDDNSSVAASSFAGPTYSKVHMTLFPLYVSRVLEKWPEDGRFRKAVHIDEAIKMLDKRPELRQVLEEVKSRGLHLMSESKVQQQEKP